MKARIYAPDERPEVVVDDPDRGWLDGELTMWDRRADGWWGQVRIVVAPGDIRTESYPAGRITELAYCPWHRGHLNCLRGCERSDGVPGA